MGMYYAHIRKGDKQGQPLLKHLSEVADLSSKYAAKVGLADLGYVLGWLHDLGKATDYFQRYLLSAAEIIPKGDSRWLDAKKLKGKIDHATAGAQVAFEYLWQTGRNESIAAQVLAICIASHHSGLIDCIAPDGKDKFSERMAKAEMDVRKSEALTNLPETAPMLRERISQRATSQLMNKLQSMYIGPEQMDIWAFKIGLLVRYLFSCLIDADRTNTADDESPEKKTIRNSGDYIAWQVLIDRLEKRLASFDEQIERNEVDDIRREVSEACLAFATRSKGIYQLTVPTGGGKTLASLRFALNHALARGGIEHIYYIVPYTSIIDQNAREIRAILEERAANNRSLDKVVLEHHSNLTPERKRVREDSDGGAVEEEYPRQSLLAENWDAPVVLTTQVQFLEALFGGGTRGVRRMHQLANSVIIFDEVQTFPVKTIHMLNTALRFLVDDCGATVVLCTATQPPLDKIPAAHRAITLSADSHIITDEKHLYERLKRVEVHDLCRKEKWSVADVASLAEEQMEVLGSTLIVVNTRKQAHDLYDVLASKQIDGVTLYHLSTHMCAAHRLATINRMKKRVGPGKPERVICVSTQLIEAGVDVDFGCVIRYRAGLDSIAQAAGRCNRGGKRKMGQVFVVNAADEKLGAGLEEIEIGAMQTETLFKMMERDPALYGGDLIGLEAMAAYYEVIFNLREGEMKYPIKTDNAVLGENLFNLLALNTNATANYPRLPATKGKRVPLAFCQAFRTAADEFRVIDTDTIGVIVQCGAGRRIVAQLQATDNLTEQRKLLKRAQRYSVNLRRSKLIDFVEEHIVNETREGSGIYYLEKEYYSLLFGWSETPVAEMPFLTA